MTFLVFYLLALLPVAVGGVLWWVSPRFHRYEWLICAVVAFAVVGCCHAVTIRGMTADEEVWSGEVVYVRYRPEWEERYTITTTITTTDSDGNSTTTTDVSVHYDTHPDKWFAGTNLGQQLDLTLKEYRRIGAAFGGVSKAVRGDRYTGRESSTQVGGDTKDYVVENATGYIEPVVRGMSFANRIKATPSVFSYEILSEEERSALPDYPFAVDPWRSGRVIGGGVSQRKWDQMMARLGYEKLVNLILVRLPTQQDARKLEAKWVGGKKNDLVLTYGNGWAHVFGWTDRSRVKHELEGLLTTRPVDDTLLPAIEAAVREHYVPVDWSKFDYLDLQPRGWHVAITAVILTIFSVAAFLICLKNDHDRED